MSDSPFDQHIDRDPNAAVRKLIRDDPAPTPTESFWSDIEASLTHAAGTTSNPGALDASVVSLADRAPNRRRRASILAAAAAAAVAVIGLTFSMTRPLDEPVPVSVTAAPEATSALDQAASSDDSAVDASTESDPAVIDPTGGDSAGSDIGSESASPPFVAAPSVEGNTPVGYGSVVGLSDDRSGLYTVAAAPVGDTTCLESAVLQFYIQPLNGEPRFAAGDHHIMGEAVTAFAADGTHAVWIEFCEFSESMHVADVAGDGTLVNARPLTAASGSNRIGSIFLLTVENGVAQAYVRPDEMGTDASGAFVETVERLDIDLATDQLLARTGLGERSSVSFPAAVMRSTGIDGTVVVLPDGRELRLGEDNMGTTVVHDAVTDTLYSTKFAQTPGNGLIVGNNPAASSTFQPVGLGQHERLLATVDDGQAWLIAQQSREQCGTNVVRRTLDGTDRLLLASSLPIDRLRVTSDTDWDANGICDGQRIPTQHFGTVERNGVDEITSLRVTTSTHIRIPNWGMVQASTSEGSRTFTSIAPAGASLTIDDGGQLSTSGNVGPQGWALEVAAYPVPVVFNLIAGWQASPIGVDEALLTMVHESGATLSVHPARSNQRAAGLEITGSEDWLISHHFWDEPEKLTAVLDRYQGPSSVITVSRFAVDGVAVHLVTEAPDGAADAQAAIDELLATVRYAS